MTEVILKNYFKDKPTAKVKRMEVHFMGESFIWFDFVMEDGQHIQTLCLRGEV